METLQTLFDWLGSPAFGAAVHGFMAAYWPVVQGLVVFAAVTIFISSVDDTFLDLAYWEGRIERFFRLTRRGPSTEEIERLPEKTIAIIVPAWQESDVIARMVVNTINSFDYSAFHIFVGTYPNDRDTIREVDRIRQRFPNVHRAEVPHDGPTSKADCLNWIVQNIFLFEEENAVAFDAFVMHDSEDVVHPFALRVINHYIEGAGMVQLPVLSMDRHPLDLVACHYMDEFAEWHGKDLVARARMSGMTPSAGVATAFSRAAFRALCEERDNQPFNTDSLTEDYDIAHRLKQMGFASRFVRYFARMPYLRKAWFRPGFVTGRRRELVATKEFFPDTVRASYRQKARWMLGISFMGWRQLGWYGSLANRYFLMRDRKALITAPTAVLAYLLVLQYLVYAGFVRFLPGFATLPPLVPFDWVWTLILINFGFLVNRLVHRAWFTGSQHGLRYAALSPLRAVVSNFISFFAFARASRQFLSHILTGRAIAWDKTQHAYPSIQELRKGQHRLGDILSYWGHVGPVELKRALDAQRAAYRPLGLQLLDLGLVQDNHLATAFAELEGTEAITFEPFEIESAVLAHVPDRLRRQHGAMPVEIENGTLTVALGEPVSAAARRAIEKATGRKARQVRFVYAPLSDIAFAIRYVERRQDFARELADVALMRNASLIDAPLESFLWRAVRKPDVRLGDALVRIGAIDHAGLSDALEAYYNAGGSGRIGEALIAAGAVNGDEVARAAAMQVRPGIDMVALAVELGIIEAGQAARLRRRRDQDMGAAA